MLSDPTIYERFMAKVFHEPSCGCWLFAGAGCPGYGLMTIGRKNYPAHVLTYRHFKGPVPEGKEVDHICRVRCCVNPDHLRALTRAENLAHARIYRAKKYKPRVKPTDPGICAALAAAGGTAHHLARAIGISPQAILRWRRIPSERIEQIEKAVGVPREVLRPEFYLPLRAAV